MVEWSEASQEVINIAEELIAKYHPVLGKYARVGFVFRSEAQVSNGRGHGSRRLPGAGKAPRA